MALYMEETFCIGDGCFQGNVMFYKASLAPFKQIRIIILDSWFNLEDSKSVMWEGKVYRAR